MKTRLLFWVASWLVSPLSYALELPTNLELDQDLHRLEQTIAFDAPPVHVRVRGMYCKRSALHDDPPEDDRPWDHAIRMAAELMNSLVAARKAERADEESRRVQLNIARDRLFEYRSLLDSQLHGSGEDAVSIDTLHATDQMAPVTLNPATGNFQEVYFFECLTASEYRDATERTRKMLATMKASLRAPVTLGPLPRGVVLHAKVHRDLPVLDRLVELAPGGPVAVAPNPPDRVFTTGANRESELPADVVKDQAAQLDPLTVRRRESYLAPSLPLSDFDGPGTCGVCRRDAMKTCFLDTCSNLSRDSMAMRNDTIGLVTRLNELQARSVSASLATRQFLNDEWHKLKRELDTRDEAIRKQIEKEARDLAQCETKCQLASHHRC